jgi:hypothetical protein
MHGVKRTKNTLEAPGFMRFLQRQADFQKKTAAEFWFEHACCIHTHIALEASAGSGSPKANKNSGRVAQWRFKRFTRDSFYRCTSLGKQH